MDISLRGAYSGTRGKCDFGGIKHLGFLKNWTKRTVMSLCQSPGDSFEVHDSGQSRIAEHFRVESVHYQLLGVWTAALEGQSFKLKSAKFGPEFPLPPPPITSIPFPFPPFSLCNLRNMRLPCRVAQSPDGRTRSRRAASSGCAGEVGENGADGWRLRRRRRRRGDSLG